MVKSFLPVPRGFGNYDVKAVSVENGLSCPEPTLTQQQFKDDNNPNVIMEKFARTNDLSLFQQRSPRYGDFTGPGTYHDALNIVTSATSTFALLPARIRSRFDNDPGKFAVFLSDDKNFDEAKELGLLRFDAKKMSDAPTAEDLSPEDFAPSEGKKSAGGKSAGNAIRVPAGFKLVPEGEMGGN